jgi:hypothetical protein
MSTAAVTPEDLLPPPEAAQDPWFYGWRYVPQKLPSGIGSLERVPLTQEDVLHPQEEDFIVNNDWHDDTRFYLRSVVRNRVADDPRARVFSDHRIDWGVPGIKPHGPDLALFRGLSDPDWDPSRGTFYVSEYLAEIMLTLEITSPATRANDLGSKMQEYHRVGIPYYFVVDLLYHRPGKPIRLLGYRWMKGSWDPISTDERGRLWMPPVELWLGVEGDHVALYDVRGRRIGNYDEVVQSAREAEQRAQQAETQAAQEAQARRAAEAQAATEAQARRAAEAQVAEMAAKLKELEAQLRKRKGKK